LPHPDGISIDGRPFETIVGLEDAAMEEDVELTGKLRVLDDEDEDDDEEDEDEAEGDDEDMPVDDKNLSKSLT
jgi:hypothetical protein